jgi:hypothetical protein
VVHPDAQSLSGTTEKNGPDNPVALWPGYSGLPKIQRIQGKQEYVAFFIRNFSVIYLSSTLGF